MKRGKVVMESGERRRRRRREEGLKEGRRGGSDKRVIKREGPQRKK